MRGEEEIQKDLWALNELIVNCPELVELESRLGSFNLFQVLRSEYAELKHSNVLAWLLDPSETHGLDAIFLQKWLMRVMHGNGNTNHKSITAVDIDAWSLWEVEVHREWRNIDLLILLKMANGKSWVVCIENKVNSTQYSGQLTKYRESVEIHFPSEGHRHVFIFLTKNGEDPEDPNFISSDYSEIHTALREAATLRQQSLGSEPKVLIENYIRLLEEKFMNDSEIARLAQSIYKKHSHALEVIFAHRPENIQTQVLSLLADMMNAGALGMNIISSPNQRSYVRFIPKEWNQPGNLHGRNWPKSNLSVLFEIDYFKAYPKFLIVAGRPPQQWLDSVMSKCTPPDFKHLSGQSRKGSWPRLYSEEIRDLPKPEELESAESAAEAIFSWIKNKLASDEMERVISIIAAELPMLEQIFQEKQSK